ncbi:hypothetical protein [Streptomyces sp. bgisy159]|uniref:hypothetical protein n=1 Tax=Streptomyces sp. bgisy159 TaxID=3413795 RepID=UPI003F4A4544
MKTTLARSLALTALLGLGALGCGSSSGSGVSWPPTASESPTATETAAPTGTGGGSAELLIGQVNDTMRSLAFTGIGNSTAFDGGTTQVAWNPDQGLRISYSATADGGKDMYCKDGVTYTSAPLLKQGLAGKGIEISVPDRLADVYVVTEADGRDCSMYFVLPGSGTFAPEKDTTVNGVRARAVVASSGPTSDTYYISVDDPARLLKLVSVRDGRTSSTTYSGFGQKQDITFPSPERTMTMDEFRAQVDAG